MKSLGWIAAATAAAAAGYYYYRMDGAETLVGHLYQDAATRAKILEHAKRSGHPAAITLVEKRLHLS